MKRAFLREHGKAGLELTEEAFVLLRTCPAAAIAAYYVGAVPFAAGFLIFCADLSRNPEAPDHFGAATLAMTGLFIWMKFFHARFNRMLLARLRGEPPPPWAPGEIFRTTCLQAILQSTALFILPLSMLATLPFGWVYAFYQNTSVLDDGKTGLRPLLRSAAQQSQLWPGQNHVLLLALSGFGLFVFLDWITLGFFVPQLLKMFFGIESAFTHSPWSLLNTTFFAAMAVLTYLSVDPLIKSCYVLRCFYGKSLQSGDDLKSEVRRLSGRATILAACLLFCLLPPQLRGAENPPAPPQAVKSEELGRSIDTVIRQSKYTWRTPRKPPEANKDGLVGGFFKSIFAAAKKTFKAMQDLAKKIAKWFPHRADSSQPQGRAAWVVPNAGLLFVILAVAACGLAIAALRLSRARRRAAVVQGTAIPTTPDLEDENTAADQLPADDWTQMGRGYLDKGELRLAIRAFYLASLAHLASRSLIMIARSKSNRDYEREIRRRGHTQPEVPVLFGENVGIFDRIWYGRHEANPELVRHFLENLEKMKAAA